jgi:hypothetical protein
MDITLMKIGVFILELLILAMKEKSLLYLAYNISIQEKIKIVS